MNTPSLPVLIPGQVLKVGQAAEILQLSKRRIYDLINSGEIPATKIKGKVRFSYRILADALLKKFIENNSELTFEELEINARKMRHRR